MGDLGIYIHIPFCRRICNYCDFYAVKNNDTERFVKNLITEINLYSHKYPKEKIKTIFIGGGSPSVIHPAQINEILKNIYDNFNTDSIKEITIETNPEDFLISDKVIDIKKIIMYKEAGINRISLGVQSFINEELKFLTRNHNAEISLKVTEELKKYFENISIDLIYFLPGQKLNDWSLNLDIAIELKIPHISAYTLIIEKETNLYRDYLKGIIKQNSQELESEMYLMTFEKLVADNYIMYEVSNFAKPGYESIHNKRYWDYCDYIGFGPSAHSFHNMKRWNNFRNIIKYNKSIESETLPVENETKLDTYKQKTEFIMLSLRSVGIDNERYKKLFNSDFFIEYENGINDLIQQGLAFRYLEHLKLTSKGYLLADEIMVNYF